MALSAIPPVRLISTMGIALRIKDDDLLLSATPSFAAEVEKKLQNISGARITVRIQKNRTERKETLILEHKI